MRSHNTTASMNTDWMVCVCVLVCKAFELHHQKSSRYHGRLPCIQLLAMWATVSVCIDVMHVTQRWRLNTLTQTHTQKTGDIWCSDDVAAVMQCWPFGVKTRSLCHICAHMHKNGQTRRLTQIVKYSWSDWLINWLIRQLISNYSDSLFTKKTTFFQLLKCKDSQLFFVLYDSKFNMFGFKTAPDRTKHLKTSSWALENFDSHFIFLSFLAF